MSHNTAVKMSRHSCRSAAMVAAALTVFLGLTSLARAEPEPSQEDIEQAKTFFGVGAQAYERGDFVSAVAAFEEAQRRAPKPAVVFSIAQAHRRQYYIDKSARHLTSAVAGYRQYLKDAPSGPRAADAAQYLAELGPAEERVDSAERAAVVAKQVTRLSVSASAASGALVSLDGAPSVEAPLITEVKPGKHVVVVTARGYLPEKREIVSVENAFVAVDVALREAPARLIVNGRTGPRLEVDGRLVGHLPLAAPVTVLPGVHIIAVSQPGHDPQVREIAFSRDESKRMDVDLRTSTQRKLACGAFIGAGALGLTTLAFAGLALDAEGSAKRILDRKATRALLPGELADYESAKDARRTHTTIAIATGAGAAVLGVAGAVLYLFDDPARTTTTVGSEPTAPPKPREPKDVVEVSFAPALGGGAVFGRF